MRDKSEPPQKGVAQEVQNDSNDPAGYSETSPIQADGWAGHFLDAERDSLIIFTDSHTLAPSGEKLAQMAENIGYRILDVAPLRSARSRLARLVDVDAVLIACTGREAGIETLLARLDTMAGGQGTRLAVVVDMDGLDIAHSIVSAPGSIILCRPSAEDLAVALTAMRARNGSHAQLNDIGGERDSDQIERLNEQLIRLNRTMEALMQNRLPLTGTFDAPGDPASELNSPARSYAGYQEAEPNRAQPLASHHVRALLRARRLREQLMIADLFADPAWDILLDLMAARLEKAQVSVSSLCIAAAVPPTTALRWIRHLTDIGLLERQADPNDGRRIFIALSDHGAGAVQRWFRDSRVHLMAALGLSDGSKSLT